MIKIFNGKMYMKLEKYEISQSIDFYGKNFNLEKVESDPDVRVGPILVDGTGVGDVANEIIQERNLLAKDGVLMVCANINPKTKAVVAGPEIVAKGFAYINENEDLKISLRCSKLLAYDGIHFGSIIREVAQSLGGNGGGHDVACGAYIPKEKKDEFLNRKKLLKSKIEESLKVFHIVYKDLYL